MQGSDRGKNQAPESAKPGRGAPHANGVHDALSVAGSSAASVSASSAASKDAPSESRRIHDPSAEGPLALRRQDGALIVTIEREERRNALSLATLKAFGNVFRYHLVPDDRAVIITGSGARAFCAGADLKERAEMSLADVRAQLVRYRTDLTWLSTCPVPTIAAINGAALGGGLELALLCDLRVAAPHASFALPETSLGIIPAAGGTQYLPRIVGSAKARELVLLGTRLSAAEALRIGLIHRICEAEVAVLDDALAWVAPITRGAPLAQHAALRALRAADRLDIDAGLEFELSCYEECLASEDRLEALAAFAEKRPPVFKGR
jgi:methylglutaconyl-CoA hydratase